MTIWQYMGNIQATIRHSMGDVLDNIWVLPKYCPNIFQILSKYVQNIVQLLTDYYPNNIQILSNTKSMYFNVFHT